MSANETLAAKLPNTGGNSPLEQVKNAAATFGESLKHASSDAAAQAGESLHHAKDQAQEAVQGALNEAAKAGHHAKEKAQEAVHDAITEAANAGQRVKEKAQEAAASVPGKVNDLGDELASIIRRYPVQSALCAMAVGFILAHSLRNPGANA